MNLNDTAGGNGDFSQVVAQTADLETPAAPVTPEPAAEPEAPEAKPAEEPVPGEPAAAAPEPELYELPDGRKMTGDQLQKEYSENLLPEFTRRSQRLAQYETGPQQQAQPTHSQPNQDPSTPWRDPNWVPQTYAEIVEAAKKDLAYEAAQSAQAHQAARTQVASQVETEITALKQADPNLNEDKLFQHALKYGFPNLTAAHRNMADMGLVTRSVEQRTAANIASRAAIPVSGKPGATVPPAQGADLATIRSSSAQDFLSRFKT